MWRSIFTRFRKLSQCTGIQAIRNGLVTLIPILMIGAFSLVLKSLPLTAYQEFIAGWSGGFLYALINGVYNVTFGLLSVYMTLSISYQYSLLKSSGARSHSGGMIIVALVCFFILSGMTTGTATEGSFGAQGTFIAILASLAGSELYVILVDRMKPVNLFSDGGDVRLTSAIKSIFPAAIVIILFAVLNYVILSITGADSIQSLFLLSANAIFRVVGSGIGGGLLFVILSSVLWFFGIHGSNVLEGVSTTMLVPALEKNAAAVAAGQTPVEILTKPFLDTFVLMGGCGATLGLFLALLLFSRRRSNRTLIKMAAFPLVFNINEILVFGLPVIYNPTLLIPFILTPVACFFTSYAATVIGLVPVVTHTVEWTTPVLIGGYMATGSVAGTLLQVFNLFLAVLIYRPFVRRYDAEKLRTAQSEYDELLQKMKYSEATGTPTVLTASDTIAKALAADLNHAINTGQLMLYYQPQYHLDGRCLGAEALLRWDHKVFGMVYPPLIIRLAQEADLLPRLEKMIVSRAAADLQRLHSETGLELKISVNITGSSIQSADFENFLTDLSARDYLPWLEITEQTALLFNDELKARFSRLHELGYHFAVDDFSMGQTSLKYLLGSQFELVKLDGSLVTGMLDNPRCRDIVSSIVQLSHSLNVDVLAEYVSSPELRDTLAGAGCTRYQGWYYSQAVPFDEFAALASGKKF